jgi:hypothetical protein
MQNKNELHHHPIKPQLETKKKVDKKILLNNGYASCIELEFNKRISRKSPFKLKLKEKSTINIKIIHLLYASLSLDTDPLKYYNNLFNYIKN